MWIYKRQDGGNHNSGLRDSIVRIMGQAFSLILLVLYCGGHLPRYIKPTFYGALILTFTRCHAAH